jgi:hypothetical protein
MSMRSMGAALVPFGKEIVGTTDLRARASTGGACAGGCLDAMTDVR